MSAIYRPQRWPIVLAATAYWLALELKALVADFATGRVTRLEEVPGEVILGASGVLFCVGIHAVLRSTASDRLVRQVGTATALTMVASIAFAIVVRLIFTHIPPFMFVGRPLTFAWFAAEASFWLFHFGLWSAFIVALVNSQRARQHEGELAAALALAQDAQLRALRYQINPHFLFNTLNSISALVWEHDNEAAKRMIVGLADLFRASLESDPTKDVHLEDEIAFQRLYLELELVRFPSNLAVDIDLPPELARAKLPSLILQPLVENVVKHGVSRGGATALRIAAWRVMDELHIEVGNRGPCQASGVSGTGTGLRNVEQRLKTRFGDRGHLEACGNSEGFYVRLEMPLQYD